MHSGGRPRISREHNAVVFTTAPQDLPYNNTSDDSYGLALGRTGHRPRIPTHHGDTICSLDGLGAQFDHGEVPQPRPFRHPDYHELHSATQGPWGLDGSLQPTTGTSLAFMGTTGLGELGFADHTTPNQIGGPSIEQHTRTELNNHASPPGRTTITIGQAYAHPNTDADSAPYTPYQPFQHVPSSSYSPMEMLGVPATQATYSWSERPFVSSSHSSASSPYTTQSDPSPLPTGQYIPPSTAPFSPMGMLQPPFQPAQASPFTCDFPACGKPSRNKYELDRHRDVTHFQAKEHYHCAFPDCSYWYARSDKIQPHWNKWHKSPSETTPTPASYYTITDHDLILHGFGPYGNCDWMTKRLPYLCTPIVCYWNRSLQRYTRGNSV